MKPFWLPSVLAFALLAVGCSNDDNPARIAPAAATFTTAGTSEEQYIADYRNFAAASYDAVYETRGTYVDPNEDHRVRWYKDGNQRIRYDIDGKWAAESPVDDFSLFFIKDVVSPRSARRITTSMRAAAAEAMPDAPRARPTSCTTSPCH